MQLSLAPGVVKRLQRELRRAGSQEIGGLLMGEHLGAELFRVIEISVQRSGGSQACFIRNPRNHQAQLKSFFTRTGEDFTRFNYLGEWHSHPSFEPAPSHTDIQTMQSIVNDPAVGVTFAILLIPKLVSNRTIEATATAFTMSGVPLEIPLLIETNRQVNSDGVARRWLRKILRF
jgi:[CysO sulfur-carrier protein]-S-L-cysteine hydrolase